MNVADWFPYSQVSIGFLYLQERNSLWEVVL
jgi:hypothetical protein